MITLYVYNKSNGLFLYSDTGLAEFVITDLSNNDKVDFTLTPPPDYKKSWRWVGVGWVEVDKPDEEKKAERWEEIKAERLQSISSGVLVKSVGKIFQTDVNSLAQYANIAGMIALDNYEPIEWKTEDSSFILLTLDVFKELQRAISHNTQEAFYLAEESKP